MWVVLTGCLISYSIQLLKQKINRLINQIYKHCVPGAFSAISFFIKTLVANSIMHVPDGQWTKTEHKFPPWPQNEKKHNRFQIVQPLIKAKGQGVKFMPCCMFMKKVPGIFVRSPSSCHPLLLLAVNFLAVNKQTYSHIQTELMSNWKQEEYWNNSRINFSSTYFSSGFR